MPNWVEGNIRVRGTYSNIAKFFAESLLVIKRENGISEELPPEIEAKDNWTLIKIPTSEYVLYDMYINGTHRNFLDKGIMIDNPHVDEELVYVQDGYRAAWRIDEPETVKAYVAMAKKYNVDIKLHGVERGMQFEESLEIMRNGKVKHKVVEYKDWDWEAPFPNMGG